MSTEASSNEKRSTLSLVDEIKLKLAQANAICNATRQARGAHTDDTVAYALLAATDFIEDSIKAFDELWETVIKPSLR